jgi:hypothetical protein
VHDLILDFIEEGVDILNPIQRSTAKMDIAPLKREFGNDICFWGGGIDVQQELPFRSPREIGDEVKRTLNIMAPGGRRRFFPVAQHPGRCAAREDRRHVPRRPYLRQVVGSQGRKAHFSASPDRVS